MAWELRGTPKTIKVTKKLATEWAELPTIQEDRPISERRLDVYRRALKEGTFRPVTWAKAYCQETDQEYRVNGKHTSRLLSSVDLKDYGDQYVVIEEYDCETIEDVAKLYATFDSRVQLRTASDINRSFAASIPELADVKTKVINVCVGGLAMAANPSQPTIGTAAEKAERLFDHSEFVLFVSGLLGGERVSTRHLLRGPVVAAMATTYWKAKGPAAEFWTAVRDETGTKPSLPDRKLAKLLTTSGIGLGLGTRKPGRLQMTQRECYVKCIHAWNAWRRSESTDLKYYADAKIPAAI